MPGRPLAPPHHVAHMANQCSLTLHASQFLTHTSSVARRTGLPECCMHERLARQALLTSAFLATTLKVWSAGKVFKALSRSPVLRSLF